MERWRNELHQSLSAAMEDSDSDEELQQQMFNQSVNSLQEGQSSQPFRTSFGGSKFGRRFLFRDRESWHDRLVFDYFGENPTYNHVKFRRRFRMRRELFLKIVQDVSAFDPWFVQKRDAVGRLGLSPLQKCTSTLRMLAYGLPADATDEYCRLGESIAIESMKRFVFAIRKCYGKVFLRQPNREDLLKQLAINEAQGFPGMFGSLDCMHWQWKNCPVAWQGQFHDKDGVRSVILEAVADQSLWIWHAFFGLPGGNNDINVLDRSPLITNLLRGEGNDLHFTVNGRQYSRYYLLTDRIYPQWSCFVQPIHEPQGEKKEHYAKMQAAVRKDVERAFGVLQARWEILKNPCCQWELHTMNDIIMSCIIMHNMIIDDESGLQLEQLFHVGVGRERMIRPFTFHDLDAGTREIENCHQHFSLRNDLVEHLWQVQGNSRN